MYSDLFDHLGSSATSSSGGPNSSRNDDKNLFTFKAGKMEMTMQENGKYWVTPDTRRGEVRITWKTQENALYWEWYDRREKMVADRYVLSPTSSSSSNNANTSGCGSLEKIVEGVKEPDRIVLWTRPSETGGSNNSNTNSDYYMYWLQDASDEKDDEIILKVNQYLADPASANPNASSSSGATGSSGRGNDDTNAGRRDGRGSEGSSTASSSERQVDALSNILENLGMPREGSGSSGSASGGTTTNASSGAVNTSTSGTSASTSNNNSSGTTSAASGGTLTLADLQGAMAGLQRQQPAVGASAPGSFAAAAAAHAAAASGPPLQELVTPAAISSLLADEAVSKRLLELLPEDQRSMQYLEENLRSPQVQQTLRSLTSALLPDDTGSFEGFHSVLANFQLQGGNEALAQNQGAPIQAFLDCVMKNVQKEEKEKKEDDKKDESESKEEGKDDKKDEEQKE